MGIRLITAPAAEPVSLAEFKLQARIDGSDEDALLALIIAAARAKAENYTGTAIMPQTWEQTLDAWPSAGGAVELLKPPVALIASVTYLDPAGLPQVLAPGAYVLDDATYPGWLLPVAGTGWPTARCGANVIGIRYITGYPSAAAVPADMKSWLLLTAAFLYEQREVMAMGERIAEIPGRFVDSLLDPYRIWKA